MSLRCLRMEVPQGPLGIRRKRILSGEEADGVSALPNWQGGGGDLGPMLRETGNSGSGKVSLIEVWARSDQLPCKNRREKREREREVWISLWTTRR